MKSKFLLLTVILWSSFLTFGHNYFVSIASMEYDSASMKINTSLKVTAHDFEHMLEMKFNLRIHIETVTDSSEIGQFIKTYLKENFVLTSGGVQAEMNYLGKEVTLRDELFFYFSFTEIRNPRTIQIKNQLLFSHFAQQQNIVNYKYGDRTKSVTLVSATPEAEIKID